MSARDQPASASAGKSHPLSARIRYYWTFIVAALLFIFIGIPIIVIGHLLKRIFELTDGRSLAANIALVEHNAAVAAEIAVALSMRRKR